jgi:hypothetical protein
MEAKGDWIAKKVCNHIEILVGETITKIKFHLYIHSSKNCCLKCDSLLLKTWMKQALILKNTITSILSQRNIKFIDYGIS